MSSRDHPSLPDIVWKWHFGSGRAQSSPQRCPLPHLQ